MNTNSVEIIKDRFNKFSDHVFYKLPSVISQYPSGPPTQGLTTFPGCTFTVKLLLALRSNPGGIALASRTSCVATLEHVEAYFSQNKRRGGGRGVRGPKEKKESTPGKFMRMEMV